MSRSTNETRSLAEYVTWKDDPEPGLTTGGIRQCGLDGCRGVRIGVRWPDGKLSWPCTKGMEKTPNGWRIP
ncbi:MAG: hypothetical protein MN733_40840 [Nitrososphaera sp.]|nr:hypothetical protein [Nitrososphaera sp.]